MEGHFKGKLLVLRIVTTLLVLLFLAFAYFNVVSYNVGIILLIIALAAFYILEKLFRKENQSQS